MTEESKLFFDVGYRLGYRQKIKDQFNEQS
jgi:hypothetical protein